MNVSGNTTFIGNSAGKYGGGISAWDYSNLGVTGNTLFVDNSADAGGGINAQSNGIANISGTTTFNGNSGSNGGCIFVECLLYLEGIASFANCSAANDGGAIHASEIHVHLAVPKYLMETELEILEEHCMHTDLSLIFLGTTHLLPTWQDLGVELYMHRKLI